MPPINFTTCSAVCIIRHLPKIRWICLKSMKFGRKSVDFLKSTEFGGKLRNSEALKTLTYFIFMYFLDEAPQHPPTPPRHMSIPHLDKKKRCPKFGYQNPNSTSTQPARTQFRQYLSCYWPDFDQSLKKAYCNHTSNIYFLESGCIFLTCRLRLLLCLETKLQLSQANSSCLLLWKMFVWAS